MDIKLTDKQYNTLKWIISIVLPALITFLAVVMGAVDWAHTELFLTVAVALETFLGTIFKVSEYQYDKEVK